MPTSDIVTSLPSTNGGGAGNKGISAGAGAGTTNAALGVSTLQRRRSEERGKKG